MYSIQLKVANTGKIDGEEVVQLYTSYPEAAAIVPQKQLKLFKKVYIPKGKNVTVSFLLQKEEVSFWSEQTHSWQVEKGRILVNIGSSSKDIRLKSLLEP
jgi:beta-glucosidase